MSQQRTDEDEIPVKATRVSFDVVEALRQLDGAGVSEVASHLGLPKSTVHDHLRTLEQLELVVNENGSYETGMRFLEYGGYTRKRKKIFEVARPEVEKLAKQTGEHSNLMVEEHGKGVFLYKAEGQEAVQLDTYNGYRVKLQTTAMGKTILAHMPEERVLEIVEREGMPQITEQTVTDVDELMDQLETIREQGYARDFEERVLGMHCVAAPILRDDEVLGAVSVSGPKSRMRGARFEEEIPDQVTRTANVIEVNMAYS